MEPKQERTLPVELIDLGAASKTTRGVTTLFPWLEEAPPPFNHRCPNC
ncbi:MAG: hypothetical protein JWO52_1630 [Gammaproteobacteria bacterium]|jgi:hypothetical protein|nr:hypothetical protein [Gammaproteobacteria bacterium]